MKGLASTKTTAIKM